MKKLLSLLLISAYALAQKIEITGFIVDKTTRKPVVNATIEVKALRSISTVSDSSGYFNISIQPGVVKIKISHISYLPFESKLKILSDTMLVIPLESRLFVFNEVVVSATRYEHDRIELSSFVDVISSQRIERTSPLSFADILSSGSAVFIKDYGGTPAQLKTITLRGTGAEHTVFLLDGNRISSIQNGLLDLSLVPIESIDRV